MGRIIYPESRKGGLGRQAPTYHVNVSKEERKKSKPKTKTKTEACNDAIAIGPVLSCPVLAPGSTFMASSIRPKIKRLGICGNIRQTNKSSLTNFKLVGIIIKIHVSSLYTFVLCSTSFPCLL